MQAKWTDQILDEVFTNLRANRPDREPARLERTRDLMNGAVRDCRVTGYEPLIPSLTPPTRTTGTFWPPPSGHAPKPS